MSNMRRKSSSSVRIFYPKFDKASLVQLIREKLEELEKELPVELIVLFGSYAKGNYTVASDADVLVVYEGKRRKNAYEAVKRVLGAPFEPHVYSKSEYGKMKSTIERMVKEGIVVFQKGKL